MRTPQPRQSFRSIRLCVVGFLRSRVAARTLHILGSQPDPPIYNQALFKCSDLYQAWFWPLRRTDSRKGQLSGFQFKPGLNLRLSDLPGFVPECAPPNRGQPQVLGQPYRPSVCHSAQKLGLSLTGQPRAHTTVAILSIHNKSLSCWRVSALSKDVARGEAACLSCVESGPKPGLNTSSDSSSSVLVCEEEGPSARRRALVLVP